MNEKENDIENGIKTPDTTDPLDAPYGHESKDD